jgi:hypothetical protein
MNWALAAGSLAAVLALAGIAWALGLGRSNVGTEDDAKDLLGELLPQFTPESVWVSHDWKTALAVSGQRIAVVRSHGSRFVAIALPGSSISRSGPDDFLIRTNDRDWRDVHFGLPLGVGDALQATLDSAADNDVSMARA